MQLKSNATCFTCQATSEVVIFGDVLASPIFYSPNSIVFFELVRTGFGGSSLEFGIHYENPHDGTKGQMQCDGDILIWNTKRFIKSECPNEIDPILITAVREPAYLFLVPNGDYILISHDKHGSRDGKTKFFFGKAEQMHEVAITDYVAYRDGGTVYITVTGGHVLYSPTPFDKSLVPTWDGVKIVELDLKEYVVLENDNTASVTRISTEIT